MIKLVCSHCNSDMLELIKEKAVIKCNSCGALDDMYQVKDRLRNVFPYQPKKEGEKPKVHRSNCEGCVCLECAHEPCEPCSHCHRDDHNPISKCIHK